MIWNRHSNLEGKHAFLSASKYHWVNDEPGQFAQRALNSYAAEIGTLLHDIARKYIQHGFKMHKYDKKSVVLELIDEGIPDHVIDSLDFDVIFVNLMTYVNDAVAFRMTPEVILYFSDNCFGTTDAIAFDEKAMSLRVHDFKSGTTKAHIEQLMIYASLFCLEYHVKPEELSEIELRIYQGSEVLFHRPSPSELRVFMDRIVERDKELKEIQGRGVYAA